MMIPVVLIKDENLLYTLALSTPKQLIIPKQTITTAATIFFWN